ncbi:hypothetical protein BGW38_007542 [Lunasporangiospora selenospora]|uniref:N-acetyltransferase domain-containing protein n=1 Tax=Lunasporangiospora selenospora TaxID=979761 RepID=A0A9P6G4B9_9FUNG|nr:hypothetical protein BGW38_007542 [Lunasporangiospora selenospora]
MYKALERNAKIEEFRQDQRGKRDSAQFKSRGLSLPAVSKKRETSIIPAQRPGDTPSVVFVPRRSLRPRPWRTPTGDDITQALPRGSVELRKTQYKRLKVQQQVEFANWKDRDDAWRTKRLANYMTSTKLAREAALFKKRKLEICGWGNPQKNLGNYLSICWDYNPDLDADKAQKLPGRPNILLKRVDAQGGCVESGYLYKPETVENEGPSHINGYCFTVQSELAFTYEPALRNLFLQASDLVQKSFFQYNMDLSLDSSLDDNFTVEVFVMDLESPMNSVRGVTQFVLMKGYIYVDKICVKHEFQRTGIGYYMMTRIFELAEKRKKDVLLYALGPVVKLYQKWGFKYCKEWPAIEKDIGVIMRKRVATKHVVDDFVGLEWDGTKFC